MKRRVKYLLFLVGTLLPTFAFSGTATIEGKVLNFNKESGDTAISICQVIYGLHGQKCKEELLDENGEFKSEIELYRTSEVLICFPENCFRFPIKPKQKIYVEIDAKEFRNHYRLLKKIKVSGDNQITNELVLDYVPKYKEQFFYHMYFENAMMRNELNYKQYYEYKTKYFKAQLKFLEDYINENQITDQLFMDWAKSRIIYTHGYDLHQLHYTGYNPIVDPFPKWYLEKIEELVPLNKEGATNSGDYETYLHYKRMGLDMEYQQSDEARKLIDNKKSIGEGKMKYLIDHSDGLSKDIMLGKKMNFYIAQGQIKLVEKYLNEITDKAIKKMIKSKLKKAKKKIIQ